jgi:hypothetical protein
MRKLLVYGFGFVLLAGTAGCGGGSEPLVKQQIGLMEELAEAIENDASQARKDQLTKRLAEVEQQISSTLSDEERGLLVQRHREEYKKAAQRLAMAKLKRSEKSEIRTPPEIGETPKKP